MILSLYYIYITGEMRSTLKKNEMNDSSMTIKIKTFHKCFRYTKKDYGKTNETTCTSKLIFWYHLVGCTNPWADSTNQVRIHNKCYHSVLSQLIKINFKAQNLSQQYFMVTTEQMNMWSQGSISHSSCSATCTLWNKVKGIKYEHMTYRLPTWIRQ